MARLLRCTVGVWSASQAPFQARRDRVGSTPTTGPAPRAWVILCQPKKETSHLPFVRTRQQCILQHGELRLCCELSVPEPTDRGARVSTSGFIGAGARCFVVIEKSHQFMLVLRRRVLECSTCRQTSSENCGGGWSDRLASSGAFARRESRRVD